jgi:hypothetical protein
VKKHVKHAQAAANSIVSHVKFPYFGTLENVLVNVLKESGEGQLIEYALHVIVGAQVVPIMLRHVLHVLLLNFSIIFHALKVVHQVYGEIN